MKYRINYSKVISQAEEIEEIVNRFSGQLRLLEQMEQECRIVWKGQAAETFITRLNLMRSAMSVTKSTMSYLSSTIKYCADRIQREDRRAEEQATALNSGH